MFDVSYLLGRALLGSSALLSWGSLLGGGSLLGRCLLGGLLSDWLLRLQNTKMKIKNERNERTTRHKGMEVHGINRQKVRRTL